MNITTQWKESLKIFLPSNFKPFFWVTLKSIVETYKVWFTYFWWLIGICFGCIFVAARLFSGPFEVAYSLKLLRALIYFLLAFTLCLSARPSIHQKNWQYFKSYLPYSIFCLFGIVFLHGGMFVFSKLIRGIGLMLWRGAAYTEYIVAQLLFLVFLFLIALVGFFFIPLLSFLPSSIWYMLFVLDSRLGFQEMLGALKNVCKTIFSTFPLSFIIFILFIPLSYQFTWILLAHMLSKVGYLGGFIINTRMAYIILELTCVALLPIPICILTNLYIKTIYGGEKAV